jgi:hypothetical protein|tara:strand:- start:5987 stop:6535 length:549 start_codon:yes stop_codon:yes gene_type:complete
MTSAEFSVYCPTLTKAVELTKEGLDGNKLKVIGKANKAGNSGELRIKNNTAKGSVLIKFRIGKKKRRKNGEIDEDEVIAGNEKICLSVKRLEKGSKERTEILKKCKEKELKGERTYDGTIFAFEEFRGFLPKNIIDKMENMKDAYYKTIKDDHLGVLVSIVYETIKGIKYYVPPVIDEKKKD